VDVDVNVIVVGVLLRVGEAALQLVDVGGDADLRPMVGIISAAWLNWKKPM